MANLEDYLLWRGDLSFETDPFNEVDNIILCELCYTDFGGIVSSSVGRPISLKMAHFKFWEKHTVEEIMDNTSSTKVAPFLMEKLLSTVRYKDIKLCGYVNEIDKESQQQFSAITFILPDGTYFVAYRGTDNTIVGWKEDCNMAFLNHTAGQASAAKYLRCKFADIDKKLIVGGHSKGGNFAMYAASFCGEEVQNKIDKIYANDAPGFRPEILKTEEYKAIQKRIIRFIPESSIVGLFLQRDKNETVIKSSNSGLSQHDIMSWQVVGRRLEPADGMDAQVVALDKTLKDWISEFDEDTRRKFFDYIFDSIYSTGADTLTELSAQGVKKTLTQLQKTFSDLDKKEKKQLVSVVTALLSSANDTVKESVRSSVNENVDEFLSGIEKHINRKFKNS